MYSGTFLRFGSPLNEPCLGGVESPYSIISAFCAEFDYNPALSLELMAADAYD